MTFEKQTESLVSVPRWQLHVDLLGNPQEGPPTGLPSVVKGLHRAVKQRLFGRLCKVSRIAIQDPVDLLGNPQQVGNALGAELEEHDKARQGVFSCAICFDEHSLEDCYIASMCGHRMCRDAAREVVLGAVRCASGFGSCAGMYVRATCRGVTGDAPEHMNAFACCKLGQLSIAVYPCDRRHWVRTQTCTALQCLDERFLIMYAIPVALLVYILACVRTSMLFLPPKAGVKGFKTAFADIAEPVHMPCRRFCRVAPLVGMCAPAEGISPCIAYSVQELLLPGTLPHLPGQVRPQVHCL